MVEAMLVDAAMLVDSEEEDSTQEWRWPTQVTEDDVGRASVVATLVAGATEEAPAVTVS